MATSTQPAQEAPTTANQAGSWQYGPTGASFVPTDTAPITANASGSTPTANVPAVNTNQPSPQNPTGTPTPTTPQAGTPPVGTANLGSTMQQAHAAAQASGTPPPQDAGMANAAVQGAISKVPQPTPPPPTTPKVDSFFQTNPTAQQIPQNLLDFLSPDSTRQDITDQMTKLQGDQVALSQEKMQLMNVQRIMSGTVQDIRTEITAASGFATESQIQGMAVTRNQTLLKQSQFLTDQLQLQQDAVNNDTSLLNSEKEMANTQFDQRMKIAQYVQTNQTNQMNAARDAYKTLMDNNPQGLYDSLSKDPQLAQSFTAITGISPEMLKGMGTTLTHVQLSDGRDVMVDKQGNIVKTLGGPTGGNTDPGLQPPVDPHSQSILAQTGLSVPAFNFLTQGTAALSRMSAAQRTQIMDEAEKYLNKNGVDISTFQSQYKAYNDVLEKNIERAANTQVFANEVAGSADALTSVIDEKDMSKGFLGGLLGISKFKPTNLVALATGGQVNDPLTQKYATQLQAMTNDYAGYLAASRGATSPELTDIQDAARVITNGLNSGSVKAFKDAVTANEEKVSGVVNKAVTNAQDQVWKLFGVTKPTAPSNNIPAAPTGMVNIQKPDGSTGYIPQSNLDAALKLGAKKL